MIAAFGTSPTISSPVTLIPRIRAFSLTSSNATCSGVSLRFVIFIDTCAMPYSSMNHPIALVPLSVPGTITGSPFSSMTGLPVIGLPVRSGRPFSRTSKAIALARRVEVVFRLKLTAMRKSRAPTATAPERATLSVNSAGPKSGLQSGLTRRSGSASYSPSRQLARLRRFSSVAAFS